MSPSVSTNRSNGKTATKGRKKASVDSYHHGDLKVTLIDTAVVMLKKMAPEQLSLRELARKAGVSQAAPYRHFKNKEELIAAISQQGFEIQAQYMQKSIHENRKDPREMYLAFSLSYFHMGLRHPQHFRLMFGTQVVPKEQYPDLLKAAQRTFILLRDVIIICQKAGVIGKGDPYHRAMNCWAVVNGFTSLYAEGRLDWLGITAENSEKAFRAFISQYLVGAAQDVVASDLQLFGSPRCAQFKEMMDKMSLEV